MFKNIFNQCSCTNTENNVSATLSLESLEIGELKENLKFGSLVSFEISLNFSLNCTLSSSRDLIAVLEIGKMEFVNGNQITEESFQYPTISLPNEVLQSYSGDLKENLSLPPNEYTFIYLRSMGNGIYKILGKSQILHLEISNNSPERKEQEILSNKQLEEVLHSRLATFSNSPSFASSKPFQNQNLAPKTNWKTEEIADEFQENIPPLKPNNQSFSLLDDLSFSKKGKIASNRPFSQYGPSEEIPSTPEILKRKNRNKFFFH